jgi:diguanylate cyclase
MSTTTKDSVTPKDSATLIESQLLALAFKNLRPMLAVNLACASGMAVKFYSEYTSIISVWIFLVFTVSLLRFILVIHYEKNNATLLTETQIRYWQRLFVIGLYTAGCLWVYILLFSFQKTSYEDRYLVTLIASALASGATAVIAPLKIAGKVYVTLLLVPCIVAWYFASDDGTIIALLGSMFCIVMLISHNNNHTILLQSLILQYQNSQLINDLQELNTTLEFRVNERTQALKQQAHRDSLTGLFNRRGLTEWIEHNLNPRSTDEAAVLFLDLDRFKQINDAMGHDAGDQVLQTIAYRFRELCPTNAILGRWGGDEFLVVIQHHSGVRRIADTLAKELIRVATDPLEIGRESLGLGLSVGIAYFPTDATDYNDVIQAADLTVAEVKRSGRGQTLAYNQTYAETQRRRFDLSRALSDAIQQHRLHLFYQPIVDAKTGQVKALEALTRWEHPVLGDIDPEEFIRLAEDTDKIIALGDWALTTACLQAKEWMKAPNPPKVAVNISIKQLLATNFYKKVLHILATTELPPTQLVLEVTESLFADEHSESTLKTVTELRHAGIEIQVDDFGTGYSSLSRLDQFPVTAIKIDKSFIAQMNKKGKVIIESAIMIAHRMGFDVIAEGVETKEQATRLTELGVTNMQGFYFSRPNKIPHLDAFDTEWLG